MVLFLFYFLVGIRGVGVGLVLMGGSHVTSLLTLLQHKWNIMSRVWTSHDNERTRQVKATQSELSPKRPNIDANDTKRANSTIMYTQRPVYSLKAPHQASR
jgi:hypothetical protein